MATVGVRELKNRLSEYLRRVKLGEEIVVTEHGKPVAHLCRLREAPGWALAMASRGELILGSGSKPTGAAGAVLKMRGRTPN